MFLIKCILYIPHLIRALHCILKYIWDTYILRIPCSYPGDPIKNPLLRAGEWPKRKRIPVATGWKYAVDKESHVITEKKAPFYPLTGESAGRQICYFDGDDSKATKKGRSKKNKEQEKEEEEEDSHFAAHQNPNS